MITIICCSAIYVLFFVHILLCTSFMSSWRTWDIKNTCSLITNRLNWNCVVSFYADSKVLQYYLSIQQKNEKLDAFLNILTLMSTAFSSWFRCPADFTCCETENCCPSSAPDPIPPFSKYFGYIYNEGQIETNIKYIRVYVHSMCGIQYILNFKNI